jgi:hypothetical protein
MNLLCLRRSSQCTIRTLYQLWARLTHRMHPFPRCLLQLVHRQPIRVIVGSLLIMKTTGRKTSCSLERTPEELEPHRDVRKPQAPCKVLSLVESI